SRWTTRAICTQPAISPSRSGRATSSATRPRTTRRVTTDGAPCQASERRTAGGAGRSVGVRGRPASGPTARSGAQDGRRTGTVGRRAPRAGLAGPRQPAQGLSRPLVLPARRDRAVLVHHLPVEWCLPDAVVQAVDGRDRVRGLVPAAQGPSDVGCLPLHSVTVVRHPP